MSSPTTFFLIPLREALSLPESHHVSSVGSPVSSLDPLSLFPNTGIINTCAVPSFLSDAVDSNSDPHACRSRVLTHRVLSPASAKLFRCTHGNDNLSKGLSLVPEWALICRCHLAPCISTSPQSQVLSTQGFLFSLLMP